MNMIMLGPPGVGKGTIAKKISAKYSWPQLSTGDMLREAIAKETEVGLKAKEFVESGKLVPDDIVIGIVKERISKDDCKAGFIFDGFPRTLPQAEAIDKEEIKIDAVLDFRASYEVIMQRLGGRRTCKKCGAIFHTKNIPPKKEGICDQCGGSLYQRDDEKPDVISKRLDVYDEQTKPLVNFYEKKEILLPINAETTADEIFRYCEEILGLVPSAPQ